MGKKKPQQKDQSAKQQQQAPVASTFAESQVGHDGSGQSSKGKGRGQESGKGRGQGQFGRGRGEVQPGRQELRAEQFPSHQQFLQHQKQPQNPPQQIQPQQVQRLPPHQQQQFPSPHPQQFQQSHQLTSQQQEQAPVASTLTESQVGHDGFGQSSKGKGRGQESGKGRGQGQSGRGKGEVQPGRQELHAEQFPSHQQFLQHQKQPQNPPQQIQPQQVQHLPPHQQQQFSSPHPQPQNPPQQIQPQQVQHLPPHQQQQFPSPQLQQFQQSHQLTTQQQQQFLAQQIQQHLQFQQSQQVPLQQQQQFPSQQNQHFQSHQQQQFLHKQQKSLPQQSQQFQSQQNQQFQSPQQQFPLQQQQQQQQKFAKGQQGRQQQHVQLPMAFDQLTVSSPDPLSASQQSVSLEHPKELEQLHSSAQPKQERKNRRGQKRETPTKESPATSSNKNTPAHTVPATTQQKPPIVTASSGVAQKSSALDIIVPQRQKLNSGGTKGRPIVIETNHLALQFKNLGTAIHYDVAIEPDKPKKLLRTVMEQFRKQKYPKRYPAFDGTKNLYSSSMLPFGQEISGEVTIQEDERDKIYKIKVKFAANVDLNVLSHYFESASRGNIHMVTPQEAIQCIDVVLRNAPALHCIPVGRSFFTKPTDRMMDLGEGMEMYYGFYQSAILGWKPFLNVDVSHKAFPKVMPVLQLIQELCDRYYDIRNPLERHNFETVDKFIRNLKVTYQIPNQPATRRVMRVNGLDAPASQYRFKNEENTEMTVAFYFERVKNVKLRYPHLPCLWVGSKQREPRILLPLEFCTIVEGQVTNRSMTSGQTSSMIKIAATSTTDRKHKIMKGIQSANYSRDQCAGEFNISVNQEFAKVQARVLEPPALQYSNRQIRPRAGVWRGDKFSLSEQLLNWAILCVDDRTRPQSLHDFAASMIKESRMMGMDIDTPDIRPPLKLMRGKEKLKLEEEFEKLKGKTLILVIIPDFVKEVYNYVKQAAELSVGVVTQCVKAKNVFRIKPTTVSNILLKVNAKLNGRNHQLAQAPACLLRPCMIMGADVTHPSPESRGSVPSVAAVTASHDKFAFQYNITWRLQPSTQEIITDLANIVREHLLFFFKKNRVKPERIIFFRDGVSEGQFEIVVQSEVQAVRNACTMLEPSGDYKPKLTFLVVQKRHHTRFFPTNPRDSEDRNMNVPAGTVVDTEITHPTALDFYLVSHASIQGVARPTKYRKLWDDHDMQEDELEELTYHLCHLFTRCNRSVSYPAPTYYAHLAAARAKVYCEGRRINMNNLDREQAQLQIKTEISKDFPMFFV